MGLNLTGLGTRRAEFHPSFVVGSLLATALPPSVVGTHVPKRWIAGGRVEFFTGHVMSWRAIIGRVRWPGRVRPMGGGVLELQFDDREWVQHEFRTFNRQWYARCAGCGGNKRVLYYPRPTRRHVYEGDGAICAECAHVMVGSFHGHSKHITALVHAARAGDWGALAKEQATGLPGGLRVRIAMEYAGIVPRIVVPGLNETRVLRILDAHAEPIEEGAHASQHT